MIKKRALFLAQIRHFFDKKSVYEVDTPHLSIASVPDLHVESLQTKSKYLQTSPELYMKRLLCKGSPDIYQLSHVFRADPISARHREEFMLLEWYRQGMSLGSLMDEVLELVRVFLPDLPVYKSSYQSLFKKFLSIDNIHFTDKNSLQKTYQLWRDPIQAQNMSIDDWRMLLMSELIEPNLQGVHLVQDFPASQASLAKISGHCAKRFELYINGIEVANGFDELQDANEQRDRFEAENHKRVAIGLSPVAIDEQFLQAMLDDGLPDCTGVALGVDRLMMAVFGADDIQSVLYGFSG